MYERTRAEGFGDEVKRRIMLGTYALSSGYYDAYYGQAQKVRTKIAEDFTAAFDGCDFVVTPTSPSVAFELGEKTDDPLAMYMNDFFTVPMSPGRHPGDLDPGRAWPSPTAAARSCRSASRSPRPPSPSSRCSRPPSRSSGRSASTRTAPRDPLEGRRMSQ